MKFKMDFITNLFKKKQKNKKVLDIESKPLQDHFVVICPLVDTKPNALKFNVNMKSTQQLKTIRVFKKVNMFEEEVNYINRLRQEIHISSNLDHINILKPIDLCYDIGLDFIVTDGGYIDGNGMLEQGYFRSENSIGFSSDLLKGLLYLHEKGVAHLDLNIENLILTIDGILKISNFSFAINHYQYIANPSYYLKKPDVYASPEFIINPIKVDAFFQQDSWAAGILIYTFFVLNLPWTLACNNDENYKVYEDSLSLTHFHTPESYKFDKLLLALLNPHPNHRASIKHSCILFNQILKDMDFKNVNLYILVNDDQNLPTFGIE